MTPATSMSTPTRTRHALLAGLFLAATTLASVPAHADDGGWWSSHSGKNMVDGSGRVQTESRPLTGFQAVALKGSMNLVLRQGTRDAVEVRADDNLLPLIETKLVDHAGMPTLEVGMKRNSSFRTHHDITVTVDVASLQALSITGSGDVVGEGLKTASLKVRLAGSGDLHLKQLAADDLAINVTGSGDAVVAGRSAKLDLAITGSGDVNTRGLSADDVSVSIAGSGDADVNAQKTLAVSIAGSGDLKYSGDAVLRSSVAGSGSVTKR